MTIKEIVQRLKTAMDDARGQESHFESWLTQNEGICDAIDALKELDKTEQEPCGGCGGSGWVTRDPDIGTDQECFVCEGTGKNIDTTPPQRKPLTDEEKQAMWARTKVYLTPKRSYFQGIADSEAAHGIKGEA